ncbi:MAG: homoserine kinase [Acidobacteriota bacterium]
MTEIIVPASTSNLGASFDTCGLALSLYLRVSIEPDEKVDGQLEIIPTGEGADHVARDESNLIARVARFVAAKRCHALRGARLHVDSEIPLARGLGSSSAAIIAGLSVYEELSGDLLSEDQLFSYALHFEGHGDNLAPSLLGGLVVACVIERSGQPALLTIKREWIEEIKLIVAVPDLELETKRMRAALPSQVSLMDAVFNVQRAALLQAAIGEGRTDLINECLRDRLHQPYRAPLAPGLAAVLEMNDQAEEYPGLLGVAISGAGSSMIAFATENCDGIADAMQARLNSFGLRSRTLVVPVDNYGRRRT